MKVINRAELQKIALITSIALVIPLIFEAVSILILSFSPENLPPGGALYWIVLVPITLGIILIFSRLFGYRFDAKEVHTYLALGILWGGVNTFVPIFIQMPLLAQKTVLISPALVLLFFLGRYFHTHK